MTPAEQAIYDESIRTLGRIAAEQSQGMPQEKFRKVLAALAVVLPTPEERDAALRLLTSMRDQDAEQLKFQHILFPLDTRAN